MKKIAVFVEGLTEQIVVREIVLRVNDYTNIGIACYRLQAGDLKDSQRVYPEGGSMEGQDRYYEIINVGNDQSVLSAIKKRLVYLSKAGFEKVIGLCDMFCDDYHELSGRRINASINQRFIDGRQQTIQQMHYAAGKIGFHFAIMEVEAWFLGMKDLFVRKDARLTPSYIKEQLGIDLESQDPELTIYHPAKETGRILALIGQSYKKHEHDIAALIAHIGKEDYVHLAQESPFCSSFTTFYNDLISD